MPKQVFSAILVMDSRKMVRAMRSQNPILTGWSRLYQAGPYYLDMSFKPEPEGLRLLGMVASTKIKAFGDAQIRLRQDDGNWIENPLESSGRFAVSVDQDQSCCLEVQIGQDVISLSNLDLN